MGSIEDVLAHAICRMADRAKKLNKLSSDSEVMGNIASAENHSCEAIGVEWSMSILQRAVKSHTKKGKR